MWRAVGDECPGSRGKPVEESVVDDPDGASTGVCPVCDERMQLGYAGLLPAHEPPREDSGP